METSINIDGKDIRFKSTGSAPLRYKMQFKRDFFSDLMKMQNAVKKDGKSQAIDFDVFDLEVFYNIAWIYAKTADPSIPYPIDWLDSFDTFPIIEIIPKLQEIITSSLGTINSKN